MYRHAPSHDAVVLPRTLVPSIVRYVACSARTSRRNSLGKGVQQLSLNPLTIHFSARTRLDLELGHPDPALVPDLGVLCALVNDGQWVRSILLA